MAPVMFKLGGWAVLVAAVGALVHFRSAVVAERYALGQALDHETEVTAEGARLRAEWEKASNPRHIRARAELELNMQDPESAQVLR